MTRVYDIRLEYSMRVICHGLVQTTQQAKLQQRSEKMKEQKILVDIVEAEIVGRDIVLAASC